MKTCINISYPINVRFRKKVHSQASDHVWFFLNLFSKRPREKKEKKMFSFYSLFGFPLQAHARAKNEEDKRRRQNN